MEQFALTWQALAKVLRQEMRQRGLWNTPPTYVGVYGWQSWQQPGALDDITNQCFTYVFVQRLRSLKAQLQVKDNIDGLVFRNVRNFLHELQKEHDPVGYRAYEVLRAAVETALEDGSLRVVDEAGQKAAGRAGSRGISGDTVLALTSAVESQGEPDTGERERRRRILDELAGQWTGELLPEFIVARGRGRDEVARRLADRLPQLAAEGVPGFRFGELLGHLRSDLRQRWAAILWQDRGSNRASRDAVEVATGGDEEDTGFVRVLSLYRPPPTPGNELVQRQAFRRLTDCVSRAVESAPVGERVRRYLDRLWQFLRTCAKSSEQVPSKRTLASFLDIPRDRMPELHRMLADYLRRCRGEREAEGHRGDQDRDSGREEP